MVDRESDGASGSGATGLGGIVTCGGESRRMGRSKAWLPIGEEVMLQRVVRLLSQVAEPVVVVAARGQELPSLPEGVRVLRDRREGVGPLEGIRVGLETLEGMVERAFVTSCDAPLLRGEFVRGVDAELGEADAAVPWDARHAHCLAAVYRTGVVSVIDELLERGVRRPLALFDRVATVRIGVDELRGVDPELQSLRNVNTPEDYEAVLESLKFEV